mgnify:FL=1
MNATLETTKYEVFATWQSVRKLADEIGVKFYSAQSSSYDRGNGMGLQWNRLWNDRIDVTGCIRTYSNNDSLNRAFVRLEEENFKLKLQLWAIKNNVEYVLVVDKYNNADYIQIVKRGA